MKKQLLTIFALVLLAGPMASEAVPITYYFAVNQLTPIGDSGYAGPNSIVWSLTLDGTTVIDIDLTLGTHQYTASEVVFGPSGTPGLEMLTVNGGGVAWTTNDFDLVVDIDTLMFSGFAYSIEGISEAWDSYSGYVSLSPIASVPEPSALALFSLGLLGLGLSRRKLN